MPFWIVSAGTTPTSAGTTVCWKVVTKVGSGKVCATSAGATTVTGTAPDTTAVGWMVTVRVYQVWPAPHCGCSTTVQPGIACSVGAARAVAVTPVASSSATSAEAIDQRLIRIRFPPDDMSDSPGGIRTRSHRSYRHRVRCTALQMACPGAAPDVEIVWRSCGGGRLAAGGQGDRPGDAVGGERLAQHQVAVEELPAGQAVVALGLQQVDHQVAQPLAGAHDERAGIEADAAALLADRQHGLEALPAGADVRAGRLLHAQHDVALHVQVQRLGQRLDGDAVLA